MGKMSTEQRKTLGSFLADKRASLRPNAASYCSARRRTPGLRREEVAVLAGVSVSWYTWIEQGRDIQVSVDALKRIANVLKLDHAEFQFLLTLAQHWPTYSYPNEYVSGKLEMMLEALEPTPAYIRNAYFDILAWNRSVTSLFLDYGALQPHERNTIRLMFLNEPYRSLIQNWEKMARSYVSDLRVARSRASNKAPFDRLATELSEKSPQFRAWWTDINITMPDQRRKRLSHPALGDCEYISLSMTVEHDPDYAVVVYLPAPATLAGDLES